MINRILNIPANQNEGVSSVKTEEVEMLELHL